MKGFGIDYIEGVFIYLFIYLFFKIYELEKGPIVRIYLLWIWSSSMNESTAP